MLSLVNLYMQHMLLPGILIYLKVMENSDAKSRFLSPEAHRSVFLNIAQGQAIENT